MTDMATDALEAARRAYLATYCDSEQRVMAGGASTDYKEWRTECPKDGPKLCGPMFGEKR